MFIKSITLDGFKSYGSRTEIKGFDRQFNAITGLNGSGKSNILDAICFVLGLQNASLARCSSMRGLITKEGSTGIQKASVCITFDNSDPKQAPQGYNVREYPEITVRREVNLKGATKYYINGYGVDGSKVKTFFHSIQLNMENPHFLIAQGRITKVLNMKPHEILSMLQEATGVSLHESTKKKTNAQLEKKDQQLRQADVLIEQTIAPKLKQLKKEQSGYMEYQKTITELEANEKKLAGFKYVKLRDHLADAEGVMASKDQEIESCESSMNDFKTQIGTLSEQIQEAERARDEQCGSKVTSMESELKAKRLEETKLTSDLNAKEGSLKVLQKSAKQVKKLLDDEKKLLASKESELSKIDGNFSNLEKKRDDDKALLEAAEKDWDSIQAGYFRGQDGNASGTLEGQLKAAQDESSAATRETNKMEKTIAHLKDEIKRNEREFAKMEGDADKESAGVRALEAEVNSLRDRVQNATFQPTGHEELVAQRTQLSQQLNGNRDRIHQLETNLNMDFHYNDPGRGFKKDSVFGPVATLFRMKDPKYARALERVAGGKLYNIIIKDEVTGKLLLDHGRLKRKVTFLPLNKMSSRGLPPQKLAAAQRILGPRGSELVFEAIDLIDYDPQLDAAMRFVFSGILVCEDMRAAEKVAYDPSVRTRVITLDGDDINPTGSLFGGAADKGVSKLELVAELNSLRDHVLQSQAQIQQLDAQIKAQAASRDKFQKLEQELVIKGRKLELMKQQLAQTSKAHQVLEVINKLKEELSAAEQALKLAADDKKSAEKRAKEIRTKLQNVEQEREREKKEAKSALDAAKKAYEKSSSIYDKKLKEVESMRLELDGFRKNIAKYESQIGSSTTDLSSQEKAVEEAAALVEEAKVVIAHLELELEEVKKAFADRTNEIKKLCRSREKISKDIDAAKLKLKQLGLERERLSNETREAEQHLKAMEHRNKWLVSEQHLFGDEAAGYGFNTRDFNPHELERRIEKLTNVKTSLAKSVNMRANMMLSDKEKEAHKVREHRQTVDKNREQLMLHIKRVDQKKRESVTQAWKKINEDFNNIFGTMLPNAKAELVVPAGKDILDGLEIRVAFGEVWKESLTELSGGQRSLVALSLVLSLLKYNPAPIYILDEVDAALDLSHTQNTGYMIKNHFKDSQFIIVSLKQDMFNNANVLFKTRFVDGNSTVARIKAASK